MLDRLAVVKVNGGRGTRMGPAGPKSLPEVKPGMSFLDVLARQVLPLRERHRARLPLVPMNSAATRGPSLGVLCRYDGLRVPDFAIRYNRTARPYTWTYDARADHARHLARTPGTATWRPPGPPQPPASR